MKKFRFRLQKVMDVKEEIEKLRMVDLAEAKKVVVLEKEKLENQRIEDRQCRRQIKEQELEDKIDPMTMDLYYRYLKKLDADMDLQNNVIVKARGETERRRRILLDASKERKVLEKLKERRCSAYRTEMTRKEQAVLDDISATHFGRRRLGNQ